MSPLIWSIVLTVALLNGCVNYRAVDSVECPNTEVVQLVSLIKNSDVRWDGDYLGLKPSLVGHSTKLLQICPKQATPALLEALKDSQRFIVAHVLLAEINNIQIERDAESWNGLHIILLSSGQSVITENQQAAVVQKWTKWHRSKL